ncbi:GAP family protein [Mycobacterium sp. LTG2003]
MWGPLFVLALLTTVNPVRLGIILLVLSRPRPMQNLLAYWAGALIIGLATLLIPLILLHSTPASAGFARDFAHPTANPAAQRTAIGIGVALIAVAALMVVRLMVRTPSRSRAPSTSDRSSTATTSTLVLDPAAPPVISRLLQPGPEGATEGGSAARRLLGRARHAWQNGSPWIAFVIGIIVLPPLDGVIFALAIIVASGAALGVQVGAVIAYMIGVLVIEEIILVSNVVAPAKTQAALRRLHDWAQAHQQKFVAAILAVVGLSLVLRGVGGL